VLALGPRPAAVLAQFRNDAEVRFAYRGGMNPLILVLSAVVAAIVAFVAVALQSHKTASANPVEAPHQV
jgi:hypothetical protein